MPGPIPQSGTIVTPAREGLGVERVLLPDDVRVAAQVAERHPALDGRPREREVEEVGHGADGDVVARERAPDRRRVGRVERPRRPRRRAPVSRFTRSAAADAIARSRSAIVTRRASPNFTRS